MGETFLITLREGLEAALIVAIVLAYLNRSDNRQHFRLVWAGVGLATVVSLGFVGIYLALGSILTGDAKPLYEGLTTLFAAGLLTWMIFWMRKASRTLKKEIEGKVGTALALGSPFALVAVTFLAVIRESAEEVVMVSPSIVKAANPLMPAVGVVLGFVLAIAVGYTFYKGAAVINLRTFFNVTGIVLIVLAAGLITYSYHELSEVLKFLPEGTLAWDLTQISPVLTPNHTVGALLKGLFAFRAAPKWPEVFVYFTYLILTMTAFVKPMLSERRPKEQAVRQSA